jgi:hypothetical protein
MNEVYETIKIRALPIMDSYQNDLLNFDKAIIDNNPGVPFIHFTGTTGTHIEFLYQHDSEAYPPEGEKVPFLFGTADRNCIVRQKIHVLSALKHGNRTSLIQYYDGRKVKKITFDESIILIRAYVADILNKWGEQL